MRNARDRMFRMGTGMSGSQIAGERSRASLLGTLALLLATWGLPAHAQVTPPITAGFAPVAVATDSIAATTTSASKALSSVPTVWATNQGSVPVCVDWGTAPAPSFPCPQGKQLGGGQSGEFAVLGAARFAAITQSATATVALVEGYESPSQAGPGNLISSVLSFKRVDCPAAGSACASLPAVQNAAYASGNDIGGLIPFTLDRTASGFLQSLSVQFIGGATTTIIGYCFDSNPTGSTFTDRSTFSIAAADEAKRINKVGIALTPAASTGDAVTAASLDNYSQPFNSTATIWCAFVAGGTFTPASTTDMRAGIRVGQGAL